MKSHERAHTLILNGLVMRFFEEKFTFLDQDLSSQRRFEVICFVSRNRVDCKTFWLSNRIDGETAIECIRHSLWFSCFFDQWRNGHFMPRKHEEL